MSSQIPKVSVRDLVDEAKKRIVILIVCAIGLSYLMSLTSSSVLVNLPAATFLIIIVRYLSLEFDMRRKTATYKSKPTSENCTKRELSEGPRVIGERSDWKNKVNSPIVEEALDHFTRHIISEWVTDLWYSRITTDRQGPEELVLIMNGVLAEISSRMRNVNLLDLITRDTINLLCSQLELFHETKTKIEEQQSRFLTIEEMDIELKSVLAADNKLHPALFSAEAEHKVLQHVMDGVIFFTFRPEDLQCSLFRYIARELLACVVIRPIINLANARFINERIESLIFSANKTAMVATHMASQSRINGSTQVSSEYIAESTDHSVNGVELVKLKDQHKKGDGDLDLENTSGTLLSKDPLLSMDTRSTISWNSTPYVHNCDGRDIQEHRSGEAWGGSPNVFSHKQIDSLAPEHLDNSWEKGRNYKTKGDVEQLADPVQRNSLGVLSNTVELPKQKKNELEARGSSLDKGVLNSGYCENPGDSDTSIHDTLTKENQDSVSLREGDYEDKSLPSEEVESWSSSYSEDEDTSNITGLDAPGIKVWDVKNKRNSSHIHHPLETLDGHRSIKARKGHVIAKRSHRTKSAKKRSRSSDYNGHLWQEGERTSFLLGDGQDILNSTDVIDKRGDSSDDGETELLGRAFSEATTSRSFSSASLPGNHNLATSSATNSIIADSFFKLRCEVSGANIVKSGSKTFTVYSISVTGVNNNSWTIKRRFQHFEELHRRLKEFPEYDLHLPPKHFLSTGLDVFVIQERCTLLDQYLKKLLQLPTISCSIEVWDFLSVDSQMYTFSDSLSIIETIPVDLNGVYEKNKGHGKNAQPVSDPISSMKENFRNENQHPESHIKGDHGCDDSTMKARDQSLSSKKPEKEVRETFQESNGESQNSEPRNTLSARNMERTVNGDGRATLSSDAIYVSPDATLPIEWVPPNVSVPLLDLVEVILQFKDGGWIRRKVFWVVKQVLQLGMGDALDDWLIGKIQLLRQGSVVASGIRRLETLLWPDGIFLTKHPRRQQPQLASPVQNSSSDQPSAPCSPQLVDNIQNMEEMQQKEAERRAKLVYEVMIDKAPAAIVGLVGRKEYEQSAKDLYCFIQSSVFMKQLTFELLQLLLSSAFPELDPVFRQLYDEKESFGELEKN